MPYFITDEAPDCSGWATIKDDGEVIGCHVTKQDAVDQMIAVSLAEDMEPGGERKKHKMKKTKPVLMGYRELPDNYRPALADDVPEGRACGNCYFYDESRVNAAGDKAWCEKWDEFVDGAYYCNAWHEDMSEAEHEAMHADDEPMPEEDRAPAPKKDQIKGSDTNPEGSASGAGGGVDFSEAVETGLRNKVTDHNDKMAQDNKPPYTRTTLGQLKSVYRRGSGAYSTSHRPGISRAAWSMARVNAFLYLLRNSRPENPAYVSDNDLLPKGHPRSTRSLEDRAIDQSAPAFMRAAARRGLEFYADGKAGDGLTDKTVREARLMAEGQVSDDKWIRISAWIARHLPDLDAPAASPTNDAYPSPGVVAHFLWGSGASKAQARRTQEFAERVVERIRAEEEDRNTLQNDKWKSIALNLNKDERQEMTTTVERRVNTVEFDVRDGEASSDGMSFTGYAAVFNSPSAPLPFTELIKEGAFQRSLKSRNEIKLFMNHNTDVVLGSTRAGTLRLSEDSRGLLAQADLPDTSAGRDLSVLMKRGDVSSMSFGFSVPPKGDKWSDDGATRELHQVRLHEVSIVTGFPAYEATTASVRSLDILASRTAVDVDALSDAITRLEAGETLEADHADLISEVVSKLRADQPTANDLLDIKRKQLDLMLKSF
jgi:HK97 family phage prohead protease